MAVKSTELRSGIFVILAMVALTVLIFSVGNFRARLIFSEHRVQGPLPLGPAIRLQSSTAGLPAGQRGSPVRRAADQPGRRIQRPGRAGPGRMPTRLNQAGRPGFPDRPPRTKAYIAGGW